MKIDQIVEAIQNSDRSEADLLLVILDKLSLAVKTRSEGIAIREDSTGAFEEGFCEHSFRHSQQLLSAAKKLCTGLAK